MTNNLSYQYLNFIILCSLFFISPYVKAQQHIYPPEKALWDADSLGNQRAIIRVNKKVKQITLAIDWRNRNVRKNQVIYVVDSTLNKVVPNVKEITTNPERGVISFETSNRLGIFYVYYLPYTLKGKYYPAVVYKTHKKFISDETKRVKFSNPKYFDLLRLEPVDSFNSNNPMEIIATKDEIAHFKKKNKEKYYVVFPEKRNFPIKMTDFLPYKWMKRSSKTIFSDTTKRGEFFTFQLGILPIMGNMEDVDIIFSNLSDMKGNTLKADSITCFNKGGIDYTGKPFRKIINIKKGKLQAIWCGMQIPKNIQPNLYKGFVTVISKNAKPTKIPIKLTITKEQALNEGIDEPWNQTRLKWLNSTLAQKNTIVKPYIPLKISNKTISLLGRKLILGSNGLPNQIQSYFTEEMTNISHKAKNILSKPFRFQFIKQNGEEIKLANSNFSYTKKEDGTVSWETTNTSSQLHMEVKGSLEFDGFVDFKIKVIAKKNLYLNDISMNIPMEETASKYILGLGFKGGKRPDKINWKWDVSHKNQDGVWLGDVNAGIQLTLKDQYYKRPLNTNFYLQKPLVLPNSWGNKNKGGIKISKKNTTVLVHNYSGKRFLKKGDTLFYNFNLLITPFHTLQTDNQWKERYYHSYKPIDSVIKSGSNIINIHHGNVLNPYINYPFIATKEMKSYIDSAHRAGLKVKIYNTIREVSNRLYELYPLMSLNHEIFPKGRVKKGYSWLQEHLHNGYMPAWYVPHFKDAAVINSGMSRWHNYYVEGMNWLVKNVGIDGIYLDDVAFDRITMKRIKRVLTQKGHPGLIDLHSANQYNKRDGFNNSAHLYMEHFPYINRLWFGEYFDYEKESPDFYLTEVSGIPFGLMGEMLQGGGNPWRGMLYGMTNRMPYQKEKPDQIWKVWDEFGMVGSKMIGYWVDSNPIKTNNSSVLSTVYLKDKKVLVSIASWASENVFVKLNINWSKLNINPDTAKIIAPKIKNFQSAAVFNPKDKILIKKGKGLLLIIE